MKDDSIISFFLGAFAGAVFIGLLVGLMVSSDDNKTAIRHHAAHWETNASGGTDFKWNDETK